jgi:hypothetical protein
MRLKLTNRKGDKDRKISEGIKRKVKEFRPASDHEFPLTPNPTFSEILTTSTTTSRLPTPKHLYKLVR